MARGTLELGVHNPGLGCSRAGGIPWLGVL